MRKAEAAARLGVSERTIDAQLSQGKLAKRRVAGGLVEVRVPRKAEDLEVEKALVLTGQYHEAIAAQMAPVLAHLTEERAQLTALVAQLTGQAELIGEQRQQIRQLEAQLAALDPRRGGPARRWWRSWRRNTAMMG